MFGDRVAGVVEECSDTDIEPKPPWRQRKEQYLNHLQSASNDAVLVSLADKLHNVRTILADYRQHGERVWDRFNAPKEDQLWYYGALLDRFRKHTDGALVEEFGRVVAELNGVSKTT